MRVGSGENSYEWIDDWAAIPESESSRMGWAHPGIVVTESGNVITCHPGDPNVMTFDRDGNLLGSWQGDFADAHGITWSTRTEPSSCGSRTTAPRGVTCTTTATRRAQTVTPGKS